MKRDMDLVRDILIEAERATRPIDGEDLHLFEGHTIAELHYHVGMMKAHGLLDADVRRTAVKDGWAYGVTVYGLTWEGADYLDAMRDARVWNRAKKAIKDAAGSVTFSVLKSVCEQVGKQLVFAQLGVA